MYVCAPVYLRCSCYLDIWRKGGGGGRGEANVGGMYVWQLGLVVVPKVVLFFFMADVRRGVMDVEQWEGGGACARSCHRWYQAHPRSAF